MEWTTKDGRLATVTIEHDAASHKVVITAELNGGMVGHGLPEPIQHPVAVARIGKLGITAGQLADIMAFVAEIKASPEWVAREAEFAANREFANRRGKELDREEQE